MFCRQIGETEWLADYKPRFGAAFCRKAVKLKKVSVIPVHIRLFADLIPEIPDKLLYLDADIMFNRDVHLLYDTDISAVEYAACPDHYGKYLIQPHYINAGVLLFNMKKARETGLF